MQKNGFQVRLAQGYVNEFKPGASRLIQQGGNFAGAVDGKFRRAIYRAAAAPGNPGGDALAGPGKPRRHLAALAKCILHELGVGAERTSRGHDR